MIGSVFTYQRLSKDFIFCQFLRIWAPIFARPKAVTDLKNALYYPLLKVAVSFNINILSSYSISLCSPIYFILLLLLAATYQCNVHSLPAGCSLLNIIYFLRLCTLLSASAYCFYFLSLASAVCFFSSFFLNMLLSPDYFFFNLLLCVFLIQLSLTYVANSCFLLLVWYS